MHPYIDIYWLFELSYTQQYHEICWLVTEKVVAERFTASDRCRPVTSLAKIVLSIHGIFHGISWKNFMKNPSNVFLWDSMEFHGIPLKIPWISWNSMEFH
jgi:hypothetical protein